MPGYFCGQVSEASFSTGLSTVDVVYPGDN